MIYLSTYINTLFIFISHGTLLISLLWLYKLKNFIIVMYNGIFEGILICDFTLSNKD